MEIYILKVKEKRNVKIVIDTGKGSKSRSNGGRKVEERVELSEKEKGGS